MDYDKDFVMNQGYSLSSCGPTVATTITHCFFVVIFLCDFLLLLFCFVCFCFLFLFCFVFCFLGPYLRHMEVPKLGVKLELYTTAYTTATAMRDWSHICNPHHSPWQCRILNPLYEARDRTCILMDDRFVSAEP